MHFPARLLARATACHDASVKGERSLGVVDAVAIIVGIIIGSGIFVAPAQVAGVSGGWGVAVALWLAAAAVAACGALTYAECSSRFPRDGGFFIYYREAFGEWLGFTGGWAAQLVTYPASVAAIAHLCASYTVSLLPGLAGFEVVIACSAIALSGVLNGFGLRSGANTQRLLTAAKLLAILGLGAAALFAGDQPLELMSEGASLPSLGAFSAALLVLLWSYDGWSDISIVAGELRDPGRMLVRSVLISMAVLAVCYVLVQLAVLAVLPLDVAAASSSVFADATEAALGPRAAAGVAALIVVSTFGSMHGIIFTVSRLGFSMARDGDFFRWFAELNEERRVPLRSLGLMVGAALIYALVSDFRELLSLFGQTVWVFYGLTGVALFIFRARGQGSVHTVFIPALAPIVLVGFALAMTVSLAVDNPARFATGIGLVSLGVPVFFLWKRVHAT